MNDRTTVMAATVAALCLCWAPAERCRAQVQPLTPEGRSTILARVLARRDVAAFAQPSLVRALAVVPAEAPDKAEVMPGGTRFAEVLLIARGKPGAVLLLISVPEAEVLRTDRPPGRPQSSVEERAEARRILQGEQIRSAAVLEGGFVVEPPQVAPADGRYLGFHVLNPGRTKILRELTVYRLTEKVWEGGYPDARC